MKISCFKACGANGPTSQGFLLSDVREGEEICISSSCPIAFCGTLLGPLGKILARILSKFFNPTSSSPKWRY